MKKIISKLCMLIPIGASIGLARIGSNVYGSLNPMLALIWFTGYKQGKLSGAVVGIVSTLVSSIYTGFGPWVIMQLILWMIAGILGGSIKDKNVSLPMICLYGFTFGVVMDIFSFYTFFNLGYPTVIAQVIGGLSFDIKYALVGTVSLSSLYIIEFIYKSLKNVVISKKDLVTE